MRKHFVGGAPATTTTAEVSDSATSITVVNGAGYPTGNDGPFVICLNRGLPSEEKVLCESRAGNVFTVAQRGFDDTSAVTHGSGASVSHVVDAETIDEANRFVNLLTTRGDLLRRGVSSAERLALGAANRVLRSNGTDPVWGRVVAADLDPDVLVATSAAAQASVVGSTLVQRTANFSVPYDTQTPIPWDSETADADGMITPTDTTLTVIRAGLYWFRVSGLTWSVSMSDRNVALRVNSSEFDFFLGNPSLGSTGRVFVGPVFLNQGSTFTVDVHHVNPFGGSGARTLTGATLRVIRLAVP